MSNQIQQLTTADIIRLFTARLGEYSMNNDLSKKACIFDVATEFRDEHRINILRILDESGMAHPDGYHFNIELGDGKEELLQRYDPVFPESMEEGGSADFQAGDIIEYDGDGLVIVGVTDSGLVGMNKDGELAKYSLATVRNFFTAREYEARLIRGGDVVRGDAIDC